MNRIRLILKYFADPIDLDYDVKVSCKFVDIKLHTGIKKVF